MKLLVAMTVMIIVLEASLPGTPNGLVHLHRQSVLINRKNRLLISGSPDNTIKPVGTLKQANPVQTIPFRAQIEGVGRSPVGESCGVVSGSHDRNHPMVWVIILEEDCAF